MASRIKGSYGLLALLLVLAAAPFWAAGPFWVDKPPEKWSDPELDALLTSSPWAQLIAAPAGADAQALRIYLSTAGPIELAEHERDRRARNKHLQSCPPGVDLKTHPLCREDSPDAPGTEMAEEYRAWLAENRATQIVLTVEVRDGSAFADEQETRRMEQESIMRIGRKKFKITGHFPPTAGDPYLRLAFPRMATADDKTITFDLYVPGVSMGFRSAEFRVKDMLMDGKLEM